MSVNVKLGNETINNVDTVRLRSADVQGEYCEFGYGEGGDLYLHFLRNSVAPYFSTFAISDSATPFATWQDLVDYYSDRGITTSVSIPVVGGSSQGGSAKSIVAAQIRPGDTTPHISVTSQGASYGVQETTSVPFTQICHDTVIEL